MSVLLRSDSVGWDVMLLSDVSKFEKQIKMGGNSINLYYACCLLLFSFTMGMMPHAIPNLGYVQVQ